jgi:hypothetical protein
VLVVGSRGITYRCVSEAPDAAPWRLRVLPAAHACRRCRSTTVAACCDSCLICGRGLSWKRGHPCANARASESCYVVVFSA